MSFRQWYMGIRRWGCRPVARRTSLKRMPGRGPLEEVELAAVRRRDGSARVATPRPDLAGLVVRHALDAGQLRGGEGLPVPTNRRQLPRSRSRPPSPGRSSSCPLPPPCRPGGSSTGRPRRRRPHPAPCRRRPGPGGCSRSRSYPRSRVAVRRRRATGRRAPPPATRMSAMNLASRAPRAHGRRGRAGTAQSPRSAGSSAAPGRGARTHDRAPPPPSAAVADATAEPNTGRRVEPRCRPDLRNGLRPHRRERPRYDDLMQRGGVFAALAPPPDRGRTHPTKPGPRRRTRRPPPSRARQPRITDDSGQRPRPLSPDLRRQLDRREATPLPLPRQMY